MPIDFFHPKNKNSYATRTASPEWKQWVRAILDPRGVNVADIGCGGGIYSRALAEVGAQVTGVHSLSSDVGSRPGAKPIFSTDPLGSGECGTDGTPRRDASTFS